MGLADISGVPVHARVSSYLWYSVRLVSWSGCRQRHLRQPQRVSHLLAFEKGGGLRFVHIADMADPELDAAAKDPLAIALVLLDRGARHKRRRSNLGSDIDVGSRTRAIYSRSAQEIA